MHPTRKTLISEGKKIVNRSDADSWRLAEIVHELHDDGMTYKAIADEFGWKRENTAALYEKVNLRRDAGSRFIDALLFAGMSEDRAIAVEAVAEADDISPHTAKTRAEVKRIVATISNLPEDQKREAARELALDKEIHQAVVDDIIDQGDQIEEKRKRREAKRETSIVEVARFAEATRQIGKSLSDLRKTRITPPVAEAIIGLCDLLDAYTSDIRALGTIVDDESIAAFLEGANDGE